MPSTSNSARLTHYGTVRRTTEPAPELIGVRLPTRIAERIRAQAHAERRSAGAVARDVLTAHFGAETDAL